MLVSARSELAELRAELADRERQLLVTRAEVETLAADVARVESSLARPSTSHGADFAYGHPNPAALRRLGFAFVCRYYSSDAAKRLTAVEAEDYRHAGLAVVSVWEDSAGAAGEGYDIGVRDAKAAESQAKAAGQPDGSPIFFAVDFDMSAAQREYVVGYFRGACDILTRSRVGCYGGYAAVEATHSAGVADYRWQTLAWSSDGHGGTNWYPHAHIRQTRNGVLCAGTECDLDLAVAANFGQW
jgi:hypothetical protein